MIAPKEELFSKLVQKTKELGRQVTFKEMEEDLGSSYRVNDYAIYYGSFSNAADAAYRKFCADSNIRLSTNGLKRKIEF